VTPEEASEAVSEVNPDALLATGFEAALIGVCYRCSQPPLATYSRRKCIEILAAQGMSHDEAEEYFEFNVVGAWMGENTPVFVDMWQQDDATLGQVD